MFKSFGILILKKYKSTKSHYFTFDEKVFHSLEILDYFQITINFVVCGFAVYNLFQCCGNEKEVIKMIEHGKRTNT